jgi:hypothetical protein
MTAIEEAQSLDPTVVRDTMDAPGFTWDYLGMPATFGGEETLGIRRQVSLWIGYSEVRNGVGEMLYMAPPQPMP